MFAVAGSVQDVALSEDQRLALEGEPTRRPPTPTPIGFRPEGLTLYDTSTRQFMWSLPGRYVAVAFSPDGRSLAAGREYLGTEIIDVPTGKIVRSIECAPAQHVAFSGALIASALPGDETHSSIAILDPTTGDCVHQLEYPGWLRSVALSSGGDYLAAQFRVPSDELIVTWDVATAKRLCQFPGWPPLFSPDGTILAAPGIADWTTELRDPRTCSLVELLDVGYPSGFTPGGQLVIDAPDGSLIVWDVSLGTSVHEVPGLPHSGALQVPSPDWRSSLVFTPGSHPWEPGTLQLMHTAP